MSRTESSKPKQSQVDKFREAARELKTDDREDVFDHLVKKIATTPQADKNKKAAD